eukprot:755713-Rhodomonas_salina.1
MAVEAEESLRRTGMKASQERSYLVRQTAALASSTEAGDPTAGRHRAFPFPSSHLPSADSQTVCTHV